VPSLIGDETVLLLVDDLRVRRDTERTLRQLGYRPIVATDDDEAVAVGLQTEIDLLVTCVTPLLHGSRRAAIELRHSRPDLRVLYVGAHEQEVILEPVPMRRVSYLGRPFARHELAVKVRDLLEIGAGRQ
jgi:DNA-binding response OmpR family regulator